jgi:hypothetical protein
MRSVARPLTVREYFALKSQQNLELRFDLLLSRHLDVAARISWFWFRTFA